MHSDGAIPAPTLNFKGGYALRGAIPGTRTLSFRALAFRRAGLDPDPMGNLRYGNLRYSNLLDRNLYKEGVA